MSTKRQAPYRHSDGSNCWTKNCSKQSTHAVLQQASKELSAISDAHVKKANLWLFECITEGKDPNVNPPQELKRSAAVLKTAQAKFDKALAADNAHRSAQVKNGQQILDRNDPEFIKTLKAKGY